MLDFIKLAEKGKSKTSSTSKTKKIKLKRKNRIENGSRALNLGINPHSKGLSFSWSGNDFFENLPPRTRTTALNPRAIKKNKINIIIINSKVFSHDLFYQNSPLFRHILHHLDGSVYTQRDKNHV